MIVPAPVIVESAWLIASELGNRAEAAFIAAMGRGELHIEDLQAIDYQRASEVLATYHDNNLAWLTPASWPSPNASRRP